MAFKPFQLKAVANMGNAGLWVYKSNDALAAVSAAGYFNAARGVLHLGDVIFATEVTGFNTPTEAYVGAANYRVTELTPNVTVGE